MYRVSTEIHFSYGHRLLDYEGKCAHPHGHNARVEVEVAAERLDAADMAVDFTVLKHTLQKWVDANLDHKMVLRRDDPLVAALEALGEPVYLMEVNPTAETLARLIFDVAASSALRVSSVRFWETPTSYATFHGPPAISRQQAADS